MESGNEPLAEIREGDEVIFVTRENLSLYLYIGKYALFNHCYIFLGPEKARYIWANSPKFDEFFQIAVDSNVPIRRAIPEPSQSDVNFYVSHATHDLDDVEKIVSNWAGQLE